MKPLAQNTLIQNRYLVVHLIGKGGMGEVYLAVDQRLGSAVALKRTFFAGDEMLGNAFEREARTLARMRHPVLPKVSDHFGEGDEQYLVMEHISGDDLSKRLEAAGKAFPVSWVLFWADQLLDALSYLHTHEPPIIHRDIKPQNLKLTDENHIILLDFGLSKTSTGQTNISQSGSTGSVVGYTPHYAPMEQIRGIGTSPRSDLYSLSATLYQLLTNRVPIDALTRADAMLNGLADPIQPPHEFNPEVPKVVSEVLLRAMEVSQEKRYANAREMQRVLRKAFNELQQATSANTVAFTAEQAEAAGVFPANPAPPSNISDASEDTPPPADSSQPIVEREAPDTDANIDLEATMAYNSFDPESGDTNQSGIKTEVFIAGGNSLPTPESDPAPPQHTDPQGYDSSGGTDADDQTNPEQPGGGAFTADATVPFIALDRDVFPEEAPVDTPPPGEPEFFDEENVPRSLEPSEDEVREADDQFSASVPAASASSAAAQPAPLAKKSSGKMIALVGGLAALILVAIVIGGAAWAYVQYGGALGGTESTPEATPEETIVPTPSPEPTVDTNANTDVGGAANSNSILVEPTPEETPFADSTPGGARPTPRTGSTPARPAGTPVPRATPRRTPVPRATVIP